MGTPVTLQGPGRHQQHRLTPPGPLETSAQALGHPATWSIGNRGRLGRQIVQQHCTLHSDTDELSTYATDTMASEKGPLVLPGDNIDPANIPTHPKKATKLGPGLRHILPDTILPTVAGQLVTDRKKNTIWVENNGGHVCGYAFVHLHDV